MNEEHLRREFSLRSCSYFGGDNRFLSEESYCRLWKLTGNLRVGVRSDDPKHPKLGDVNSFTETIRSRPKIAGYMSGITIGEDLQFENHQLAPWRDGLPMGSSMIGVSRNVIREIGFDGHFQGLREIVTQVVQDYCGKVLCILEKEPCVPLAHRIIDKLAIDFSELKPLNVDSTMNNVDIRKWRELF